MSSLVPVPTAAPLTPAVRLAKVISEFSSALDEKYRPIFKTWQTHSPPSEIDFIRLTEEINRDGSRLHQTSWKPFGTRLLKFLDQIQLLIKPGDILVGGSQNMIASGVWATVRLSLEIATGHLSYFERLSLLLMRLGHATIIQRDRVLLFPHDSDLKALTCEYLIVITEMCKTIIGFEKKGFLAQLATSTCLEKEFKEFETQLAFWSKVINKKLAYLNEASQAQANTSIAAISGSLSSWGESRKRRAEDWRIQVLRQLSPHQDEFESTWRRERRKGSVEWIFDDEQYMNWRSASSSSTLLIHGSLGSGKTVTMANITGKFWPSLSTEPQPGLCAVASFFCQSMDRKTLLPRTLFGSIAHQFLRSLRLPADHPAIRQYSQEYTANDTESIIEFIKAHFPDHCHYYVIMDGLDELSAEDAQEVLRPLADLQTHLQLHICCSVRFDSLIRPMVLELLRTVHSISMSCSRKDREIESYIKGELSRRTLAQRLDEATKEHVQNILVQGAQGMYLWVVLQLNALFPLYGETLTVLGDFARILDRLPTGLFESFEQALGRIKDDKYGSRIFEIVTAAIRPLTKNELRSALNIEPGVPFWDDSTLPLDAEAMVYRCGGGLLYIDEEENTVHYIHHSALRHVLVDSEAECLEDLSKEQNLEGVSSSPQIDSAKNHGLGPAPGKRQHGIFLFTLRQADSTIGFICITALNLEQLDRRISRQRKLVFDKKSLQTISDATTRESLLACFMKTIIQQQRPQQQTPKFDLGRILEVISTAKSSVTVGEAQLFFSYAEAHWLDHTSRPYFNLQEETKFNDLFLKLISENAPGLIFPWDDDKSNNNIALWAHANSHLRLLHHLLCDSKGPECRNVVHTLSKASRSHLSGFSCHKDRLTDVLCRLVDYDFLNVAGVETLLCLGAQPNETYRNGARQGLTPLQVAIERMTENKSYEADVVRALLQGGADAKGSSSGKPPILIAIDAHWGVGYQMLFLSGARVYPVRDYLGHGWSDSMLSALDLAMFRGKDADDMITDLSDCGADIKHYFQEQCWPVSSRSANERPADVLKLSAFSGEGDDWVNIQQIEAQQHHYLSVQDQAQADSRVLKWLLKARCDVNIVSANGMTPLGLAIALLDVRLTRDLLSARANPNARYVSTVSECFQWPLVDAARQGSVEIVRVLLDEGASIHKRSQGKTILRLALEEQRRLNRNLVAIQKALNGFTGSLESVVATDPSILSTITLAIVRPARGSLVLNYRPKLVFHDTWTAIADGVEILSKEI
ncbi:uncharacterized protein FFNC_09746 [Fusarium fujikuroi]|uniref:Nephrocystin 3-like N-terminal domain-containing protein n=1 Tax=Fusarium fujikuroi TaxID=5127 RepID=A0A9Q9U520_FUSFU|nr:uncharacterized protein FFNC_09746 [Fusarium fujikuroi]SCV49476.1 uncharacterized protein FFFS_09073 [Fusarium fujikuroi]VTT57680.1 unnamed protein product [Fusarium fujikuroi]